MRLLPTCSIALVLGAGCGGGCEPIPQSDRCDSPGRAQLTSLELGVGAGAAFTPLADDQIVDLEYGPQGGAMVAVHLRMRGEIPRCLEQTTAGYDQFGEQVASEAYPLTTYDADDGYRTTGRLWVVLYYGVSEGEPVRLVSEAGGQRVERRVWLVRQGADAAPDAHTAPDANADAGPGDGDAAPAADAGAPGDAGDLDAAAPEDAPGADAGEDAHG